MASEIKVDTISEKTSTNGVAIDGLTIKDGGLGGHDITFADGAYDFDIASHDTSNGLKLGGTLVTATAAELNIMDGVTATAAEINLIDGGTARGTTAIADGDGVLINDAGTMRMTTVQTLATYIGGSDPSSADGDTLGTASLEWSDLYLADSSVIYFGNDQEITLTHSADSGLLLKHTATADDKPINLVLQTGETDMAADDVIGKISFQAPDEGTGTDAVLVSAAIQAVAEGDHSSSSNATRLEFHTGASELATAKMNISSAGDVGIGGTPVADRKLKIFGTASNRALVVANSGDQYAYATFVGNNTTDDGQVRFGACDDAAIIMAGNAVALRITDAQKVGIGESSPLGQLHVKSADSGAAAHANADELVIEGSGASGMTIASGASSNGCIFFSDSGDNNIGYIEYKHGTNAMTFGTNAANAINVDSTGAVTKPLQPSCLVGHNGTGLGNSTGDGTWKTLDFNTEIYDTNGDHSAGVFTAPVTGRYLSTITCSAQGVTSSENFMRLYCVASNRSDNNWSFHCDDMLWSSGGTAGIAINAVQIMDMDASDTLYWKVNFANGSKVVDIEDTILMSVECLG